MGTRRLRLDITPLRTSRDFRLLVTTQTVSSFGAYITYVALPIQVKVLTGSYVAGGLLGLCELAPLLVTALVGGALADYLDRRKLIIFGEIAMLAVVAGLLATSLRPHPSVWVLYVVAALTAAFDGLQRPAIEGLMQRVVPLEQQTAAAAIRSLGGQISMIAGPGAAGLLVASVGF